MGAQSQKKKGKIIINMEFESSIHLGSLNNYCTTGDFKFEQTHIY